VRTSTDAVLLRKVDHGEADLILTFFTAVYGRVTAIAYSARRSRRRFAGMEPFHTLRIEVDSGVREMATLHSAHIAVARLGLMDGLDRMQMAGMALGWVRDACPDRQPETAVWEALTNFLDAAETAAAEDVATEAAAFGLRLLVALGWAPPPSSVRRGAEPARVIRVVSETIREQRGR